MEFSEEWLNPVIEYYVYRECWPEWMLPKQQITFYDFTYVHKGEAVYSINEKTYFMNQGDAIFIPAGSYRAASTSVGNPMSCYAFNFTVKGNFAPLQKVFHIGDDEEFLHLCAEFNRVWLEKKQSYKMYSTGCFLMLMSRLIQLNSESGVTSQDKRIEKAKDYIMHNYFRQIDLKILAHRAGLNHVYFGSKFHHATGLTVKQYINRIRINKAADLLSTGGFNVSEAAYKCGFSDVFYFSRLFKRSVGINPSELLK